MACRVSLLIVFLGLVAIGGSPVVQGQQPAGVGQERSGAVEGGDRLAGSGAPGDGAARVREAEILTDAIAVVADALLEQRTAAFREESIC